MSQTDRDFYLAGRAGDVADRVAILADATVQVLKGPERAADGRAILEVRELSGRFVELVFGLQTLAIEHHAGMSEAQVRDWSQRVVAELRR